MNTPNTGPVATPTSTNRVSSALAAVADSPCPATRYGTPQSSANTVPENWVPVCVHSPSRVPGSFQDATSPASTCRGDGAGGGAGAPAGRLRTTASTASATAIPSAAAETNAVLHPGPCSSAANGSADSTWPDCPSRPVSWVINGTRRGGNQAVTTDSTLMNVSASPRRPAPVRSPPAAAWSARASTSCPVAMMSAPATISRRAPKRSSSMPTGTCSTA